MKRDDEALASTNSNTATDTDTSASISSPTKRTRVIPSSIGGSTSSPQTKVKETPQSPNKRAKTAPIASPSPSKSKAKATPEAVSKAAKSPAKSSSAVSSANKAKAEAKAEAKSPTPTQEQDIALPFYDKRIAVTGLLPGIAGGDRDALEEQIMQFGGKVSIYHISSRICSSVSAAIVTTIEDAY